MRINSNEDSLELEVLDDAVQTAIEGKGFHGLITSKAMTAKEANDVYDLRDCSEKQYSLMKTQLGDSVFRTHSMHRIAVREMIAFVASIIRHEIMVKCRTARPSIDTNVAIKELNLINMNLIGSNRYRVIRNQCKRQKEIMSLLGITYESLDHFATYETDRLNQRTVHPIQSLLPSDKSASGKQVKSLHNEANDSTGKNDEDNQKASGAGRTDNVPESGLKHGPGSPKGSKNKSKTQEQDPIIKRGPGRPKGSKNKPKVETSEPIVKRKPGRPKGSKNKPKT